MSSRPKRKATNRSYNDTLDETAFEEKPPAPAAKTRKKAPPTAAETKKTPKETPPNLPISNWQPPLGPEAVFSHRLNLLDAYIETESQRLICPNQPTGAPSQPKRRKKDPFLLQKGDYIYMVSEPPGEPYYIGRILGFKTKHKQKAVLGPHPASDYVFQIQWYYRPRDISKATLDLRLLFASMHSDTCPLQSFRGRVTVKHKQTVEEEHVTGLEAASPTPATPLEAYSQLPNCFYFDKLFDRYMLKFYDIVPTQLLLVYLQNPHNNSHNFLKALHKRFEFVFVESARTKLFLHGFSSTLSCHCGICGEWCLGPESVVCGVCHCHYHMLCLDPPLLKKPSRGFLWSCAPCTKKHEIEHQSKKMLMLLHDNKLSNEQELTRELSVLSSQQQLQNQAPSSDDDSTESPEEGLQTPHLKPDLLPKYELIAADFLARDSDLSLEERRLKEEWPMRYLGMHARLEDGVDVEDRSPYPRASTRLGAKHQATHIPEYEDHPIVYYDTDKGPVQARKKPGPPKRAKKVEKDVVTRLEIPDEYKDTAPKDYPRWLQPRPKGYVERGGDGEESTSTLLWKPLEKDKTEDFSALDAYMAKCGHIAEKLGLHPNSPNFMDAILNFYFVAQGQETEAFKKVQKLTREALKEPSFSAEEIKKFEAGVKKFGSELYPTYKKVKTQLCAMVVRFYYLWKKSENGRKIWGNFEGRMQKKLQNTKDENKMRETAENGKDTSDVAEKGTIQSENGAKLENGTKLSQNGTATSQNGTIISKNGTERPAIDQYADPEDDSAYENDKIAANPRPFHCKHCQTPESVQWFRITGYNATTKYDNGKEGIDKNAVTGLCMRCARLWRRYAVIWDDPYEVEKRNTRGVGGWKKKVEAELVRDAEAILAHTAGLGDNMEVDEIGPIKSSSVPEPSPPTPKKRAVTAKRAPAKAKKNEEPEQSAPKAKRSKKVKEEGPKESSKEVKEEEQDIKEEIKETKKAKGGPKKRASTKETAPEGTAPKAKRKKKAGSADNGKLSKYDALLAEAHTKRQKRRSTVASGPEEALNPVVNRDYCLPETLLPEGPLSTASLEAIMVNFRTYQLTALQEQMEALQANLVTEKEHLDEKVLTNGVEKNQIVLISRFCSVCLEEDTSDLLTCASCEVSAHMSCIGLPVPRLVQKPVSGWLCEPCGNQLEPKHRAKYECCLCVGNGSRTAEDRDEKTNEGVLKTGNDCEKESGGVTKHEIEVEKALLLEEPEKAFTKASALSEGSASSKDSVLSKEFVSPQESALTQTSGLSYEKALFQEHALPPTNGFSEDNVISHKTDLAQEKNPSPQESTPSLLEGSPPVQETPPARRPFSIPPKQVAFLKPVHGTGQWCHWICALFAHEDVSFKHITSPVYSRRTPQDGHDKDRTLVSEAIQAHTAIESVLASLVRNLSRLCAICHSFGGSLVSCGSCDDIFHVTCAQTTPGFRIGFSLTPTKPLPGRGHQPLARVGDQTGILVPSVVCKKHDTSVLLFGLREPGKRVHGVGREETRPLIQLFIDDTVRANSANKLRLSGPQFLAHSYMTMIRQFADRKPVSEEKDVGSSRSCSRCRTPASPMWWPGPSGSENVLCQGCYHRSMAAAEGDIGEEEVPGLLEVLNEPLDGRNYGLAAADDRLDAVFTPGWDRSRDQNKPGEFASVVAQTDTVA